MAKPNMRKLRQKTAIALVKRMETWGKDVTRGDYIVDQLYRHLADLPPLPMGNVPLAGFFPQQKAYQRLFCGVKVPEHQLRMHNYVSVNCPVLGRLVITGGFMEAHGHSRKSEKNAIFANGSLKYLKPGNRNLGIDYVTPLIRAWYDGTCIKVTWEKGYGNRAYFRWDLNYVYEGKEYPVYGAFAHADSFTIENGDRVSQGTVLGKQGGTGGNYPPHIDYRQWIKFQGQTVDLSPNALEAQLHA